MVFKFLGMGKRKPRLKLDSRQEVEVEVVRGDNVQNYFTRVVAVERRRIILSTPTQNRVEVPLDAGDNVVLTFLDKDLSTIYTFGSSVLDCNEREFQISQPADITEEKTLVADADFSIDIPIPVEYRAMSTTYLQTATTRTISAAGINILTNLAIPPSTSLHIELQIPNAPTVKTQGRVTRSKKLPHDKKCLTEIEFDDITPADKELVYRYALFYRQRQMRKTNREELHAIGGS